jgi:DNA-binding XRE family transcriptional regulator
MSQYMPRKTTPTADSYSEPENSADELNELPFGRLLKFWRAVHHLSQEELAHSLGSSTRHISRMENGRVHPSKAMAEGIAKELSLGERDTLHLFMSAGFTGVPKKVDFHAPELKWLRKVMGLTLQALDPYPSALLDHVGNILMVNRGWVGFYQSVAPKENLATIKNHFEFLFSGEGGRNALSEWEETLSMILMALQQSVLMSGDKTVQELLDRLVKSPNAPKDWQQLAAKLEPMTSYRLQVELNDALQKFFSVSQTVGALGPNAFVSEPYLTVNTLYPANETLDLSTLIEGELTHPLLFY